MSIIETVKRLEDFYSIDCKITTIPFNSYRQLPTKLRGIYVLEDADGKVMYVGKGFVRARQKSHADKINDIAPYYPLGWLWLKENFEIQHDSWKLNYIELNKETERSAIEGGLIHILQPLANDETFKDEGRTLKETK